MLKDRVLRGSALIARGLADGRSFLAAMAAHVRRIHAAGVRVWASVANIGSDRLRDRAAATATFAAIALFGAFSLDVLLGGAAELGSSADAAQPAVRYVTLAALPEIPYRAPDAFVAAPPDRARVVTVSYAPAAEELLGGPIAGEEEAQADTAPEVEAAPEISDALVKQEMPIAPEAIKTVAF